MYSAYLRITDAVETPIRDAAVTLDGETQQTDANGEVLFLKNVGSYDVTAEAALYQTYADSVTVDATGNVQVIALQAKGASFDPLTGTLTLESGFTAWTAASGGEEIGGETVGKCTEDVIVYVENDSGDRTPYRIEALGHDYDAVVTPPTCTETGYTTYTCTRCGDSYVADETAALGHDLVHHDAKAPTCTAIGWAAYDTCSRCDYTTYVELPATDHTAGAAVRENEHTPTCTAAGSYDEGVYCSVCDAELSRVTKPIPATGHTAGAAVRENEHAPTCTAAGSYDEVVYCSVCDSELSRVTKPIAALGHDLTYAADGAVLTETCSRCEHTANASISAVRSRYTGEPVTAATVDYSEDWLGGELEIAYANNTAFGTATASITAGGATAVTTFRIYVPGDVDGNGTVNMRDVLRLRQYMAGGYGVTVDPDDGDVDHNGSINMRDVLRLRQYMAGGYGVVLT